MHARMLRSVPNTNTVIDPQEIALATVIADNPITKELVAPLGMSDAVFQRVKETWEKPSPAGLKNPRKFSVFYEFDETTEGYVVVEMKYDGKLDVGVHVYDEHDDEINGSPLWVSKLGRAVKLESELPSTLETIKISDKLWTSFHPVQPIRSGEPVTMPNSPCPCGSGKKHKKCCGRLP